VDDGGDDKRPSGQGSGEEKPRQDRGGRQGESNKGEDEGRSSGGRKANSILHNPLFLILGAVVVVVLIVLALLWWLNARNWVTTDDAYVDTTIVHLAPQVPGQVQRVLVTDNQSLQAGQLLVEIEPSTFRAQVQQAEAGRAQAVSGMDQARAQIAVDQAKLEQAEADARAAQAQAIKAARDLERYDALRRINAAAVSQEQLDQYAAQAANTADQRDAAERAVKAAAAQLASTRTQIGAAEAKQKSAEAQLRQQGVNLADTRIIAPVAGTVAHKTVAAGDYVQAGQELMAIVPQAVWVTANYKETQLAQVRAGQYAEIRIDACKGIKLTGKVDSIQRGAGQAFALLPAENATGNYVKVVQRVPVKIVLDDVPKACVIGPGMSVAPKIRIR
jgi:membrane fusion protein (multidrug efflux system)